MSSADLTAGTVFEHAAALLNDTAQAVYTDAVQVPYLNLALQELQEIFELNNVPVTDQITTDPINIPAGYSSIRFSGVAPQPLLPADLIEPQKLWERQEGVDPYVPMTKLGALPLYMEGIEISSFGWWIWEAQEIRFFPSTQDNDIKIEYIRNLFNPVASESSLINIVNAASFLEFETAGLCAQFIGENETRAASLYKKAEDALDRATGIGTKGRQAMVTRRRPFRSAYKRRSYI